MHLSALYRYPLKSAAGQSLVRAQTDPLGLVDDRRWMLADAVSGRFISQRTLPKLGLLKATPIPAGLLLEAAGAGRIEIARPNGEAQQFRVGIWAEQADALDAGDLAAGWLGGVLGIACRLVYLPVERGVPVDTAYAASGEQTAFTDGYPFLLLNQASLDDLCARVGRRLEILRFRPNLVIQGALAYAEDEWRRIRIGEVAFRVVKPCTRCVVTTLDPASGTRDGQSEPLATLARYRRTAAGVVFGQNLIAENLGDLETGMNVEVLA